MWELSASFCLDVYHTLSLQYLGGLYLYVVSCPASLWERPANITACGIPPAQGICQGIFDTPTVLTLKLVSVPKVENCTVN